ncbi:hypothetical protein [Spirosoma arcticum]
MQGVSLITDQQGNPRILTIDVQQHDSQLNPLIAGLLDLIRQQDEDTERADFYAQSIQGLARAYGDDEPDYSDAELTWTNPNYKP